MPAILLIGHGAIAAEVRAAATRTGAYQIGAVLVRPERVDEVCAELPGIRVIDSLSDLTFIPVLAVECASHAAVRTYGAAILRRGIDLVVASVGALADDSLLDELEAAALDGQAKLILPAGAVPGVDALNAAAIGSLAKVSYISRKPPAAWAGTPAETRLANSEEEGPIAFYAGSARAAARDYPKNANVAAIIALAGLGFDETAVQLVADPGVDANVHEIVAEGSFGKMQLRIEGRPLADNQKTSALAAFSVIRSILNRLRAVQI